MAEWSKALALGASPRGRGFEPHSYHTRRTAAARRAAALFGTFGLFLAGRGRRAAGPPAARGAWGTPCGPEQVAGRRQWGLLATRATTLRACLLASLDLLVAKPPRSERSTAEAKTSLDSNLQPVSPAEAFTCQGASASSAVLIGAGASDGARVACPRLARLSARLRQWA